MQREGGAATNRHSCPGDPKLEEEDHLGWDNDKRESQRRIFFFEKGDSEKVERESESVPC